VTGSSGQSADLTEAHLECLIEDCWFAGLVTVDVDPEDRTAAWRCPSCDTVQTVEWECLF
jgi:hypothetical protein